MKSQCLTTHYNGLDIVQARHVMSAYCGSYVCKLLATHGWADMHPVHLSMTVDNAHIHILDTTLSPNNTEECDILGVANFCCIGAVGELTWAIIMCYP